ncbi:MAG TPA: hypothetical protein VIP70_00860 [Nitrososphaeraceae archaeon]
MTNQQQMKEKKKSETTRLENSTYDIHRALHKDADFLYDTVDIYISDAQKANRSNLLEI